MISLKTCFSKRSSDIAAAALTKAIIVPIVAQGAGAFASLFGTGKGAGLEGLFGTQLVGGTGGGAGLTVGGAISGIGSGVGAGFGLRQVNDVIGLTGLLGKRGSSALAGAGGGALSGALLGSTIVPGIGTAVGAVIGTLLGALGGGLLGGGGKRQPELTLRRANAPRFSFDETSGFSIDGGFGIGSRSRNFGQGHLPVHEAITRSTNELLDGLASTIGEFPKELQARAVPELQRLADEFGATFEGVRFQGKDVEKQVSTFLNETIPTTFDNIFSPFVERLKRVAPVLAEFDRVIKELEDQQANLLYTLDAARAAILQGPQTAASAFQEGRGLLDTLVARSEGGSPAEQAALVPQIAALAQEVAALSRQEGALVSFNQELRDLHAAVEASTSALQAQEEGLIASQAALDAERETLESALQAQEDALDAQREVSAAQIQALEDGLDTARQVSEGLIQAQEDALEATREGFELALQAQEDAIRANEIAVENSLRIEEEALEAREDAFEVALKAEEKTLRANQEAVSAAFRQAEDVLDAQTEAVRDTFRAAEEALDAQRAAAEASLEAEEEALDAAATALRTLEDTLQASLRVSTRWPNPSPVHARR